MRQDADFVSQRISWIREEIKRALDDAPASSAPAAIERIRLVGVSKYLAPDDMLELRAAGLNIFAENRTQVALPKLDFFRDHPEAAPEEWHFIGSIQRNKAAKLLGKFSLMHAIDRMELARTLSALAVKAGIRQRILLQVNVSREEQKHGFLPDELAASMGELFDMPGLSVEGLMGMAAAGGGEDARLAFRALRQLRDQLDPGCGRLHELSMGMSGDFRLAVQEGATLLRIGSLLYEA